MSSIEFFIGIFTSRLRLVAFGLIFFFFLLETFWPYLVRVRHRSRHTARNLGLMLVYLLFASPVNYFGDYWYHRLSHVWWPLWGYHRVHHSDGEMDVTTGYR